MIFRRFIAVLVATGSCVAFSATVETTATFGLDNVLASRLVRSGERVTVVRDASWADEGVVFSMSGMDDEVLVTGLREDVVMPAVDHFKVITLTLQAGGASYSYAYLVADGEPNCLAEMALDFPLDSRTGALRVAQPREALAYSTRWSAEVGPVTISIRGPDDLREEASFTGEGTYFWNVGSPYRSPRLQPGIYDLTLTKGGMTQTARFRVPSIGLMLFVR